MNCHGDDEILGDRSNELTVKNGLVTVKIGYARVSTDEQNLDMQLLALQNYGCDTIHSDHGISGSTMDRKGLLGALAQLGPGDTLVVWRLDRLGRSLSHLVALMNTIRARGIHFASITELIDTGSPMGMFMFHMIAALAEFERSLISERTRAGVSAARIRGKTLGRPKSLTPGQLDEARLLLRECSEDDVAQQYRVHPRTLRRLVRESKCGPNSTDNKCAAAQLPNLSAPK